MRETTGTSPRMVLFTDASHIVCGDLNWIDAAGRSLPLNRPPEPPVQVRADLQQLPRGIRLLALKPCRTDPVPEGVAPGRVIRDGGVYRSWVLRPVYPPGEDIGCYTKIAPAAVEIVCRESPDGFDWRETAAGRIDAPGQTAFDGFTFFIDPAGPAHERYKAVYMAEPPNSRRASLWAEYQKVHPRHRHVSLSADYITCMYGAVSPDGLHWRAIPEPLFIHKSDTDTTVYYDDWLRRYVMYTRLYVRQRRWVGRVEAEDFRRWGPVGPLLWPAADWALSDDIYTNGRTEYPGLPGTHLMFPMIYHRFDQTSQVRMYSSPDGIAWTEAPGGPVISPGGPGTWDAEFISAGKDLVPFGPDRVAIPYNGAAFPHKYPRWPEVRSAMRWGWACWPAGRLCAVAADGDGEFWTVPLVPAGRQLRVNVRAPHAGSVRVGLEGVPGRSAEDCDPISGDHPAAPVHWHGRTDIDIPPGRPVSLHFRLRAAELFAFEWV